MTESESNPATGGRPITPEDLFKINVVSDPQPSPNGRLVAYVVTRLDQEADDYKAAIWLVPTEGGAPTQLTGGASRDTSPRWSPDGSQIAFVSNRPGLPVVKAKKDAEKADEKKKEAEKGPSKPPTQIWAIRVGGGEARQLTRQEFGASSPAWSPDGRTIAFLSGTEPDGEPGVPEPAHKKVADERIVTKLRYRFDGRGYIDRYQHVWTVAAEGGEARQLTFGDADDGQIAWSPDGRSIAFVANRHPDRDQINVALLYTVPAHGGELRCLTEGNYDFDSPSWSPDGTRIAVAGTDDPDSGGAKNANLWTVAAGGGTPTNHSKSWDRSVGDQGMSDVFQAADQRPIWSVDGKTVDVLASDSGTTHVYRVALDSGSVSQVTSGPRRVAGVGYAGDTLILNVADSAHPFELFAAGLDGKGERRLTEHNRAFLDEVALTEAEEFTFRSQAGDLEIQGWILKPHGFREGVKYPLIVQVHGGPHAMYGQAVFHEMQLMAARGYVVVFTNPRGSAGYGEEFTTCTRGRWGESDMPDVMGAVDAILERGYVDEARMGVTGGSYGGYMTNWIIGHTDRFKAAVTQRCVSNFYSMVGTSDIGAHFGVYEFGGTPWADAEHLLKYSPISYVANMKTPLLIIHNEQDLRCPIEQAEQLFTFLKRLGNEVAMVRVPGEDHNLSRTGTPSRRLARLHHLVGWFDSHL